MDALERQTSLIRSLAEIVANYTIHGDAFTSSDWKRVFRTQTEELELDDEFYEFWFSPDAEDPTQLNCDTHFLPILRPETATEVIPPARRHRFAQYIDRTEYSLETLGRLVEDPQEGHPSRFAYDSGALSQNGKTKAGPPCYLVARKELFARGLSPDAQREYMKELNARTHAGYEVLPSSLDLATVALVHHAVTGERYLGDATGMENRWTESRSEDTVKNGKNTYPVTVGSHTPLVGGPGLSGGLFFTHYDGSGYVSIGVVGLRKFSGHRKLNP